MFDQDNPFKGTFGNLENFVDHVSETLQCPITIEDANHRLLAYSMHDDRTDSARISTIIGRRVPEKVINTLWKDGIIPALNKQDEPVRVHSISDIGLGDRVAIAIRKKQQVLGYIWALEVDRKLTDDDYTLLQQAATSAKNQLMQLQIRREKQEENYQEFFWQILTGHVDSETEAIKQFERLQVTPPPSFAVVVLQFTDVIRQKSEKQIEYLLKTTQKVNVVFYTIDQNELVLLVSPKLPEQPYEAIDTFINTFIVQMNERFSVKNIAGGCGTIYENLQKVSNSYQEANSVLKIKSRFPKEIESIYNYQSLGIYQFLDVIYEKRVAEKFENKTIKQLKDYDQKHNSSLLETLEAYLDEDSNINRAAKSLHIHVNTMNYRLKRIAEIGELDLKDPNQKTTLYIDLKILKYQR
ncbi:PucR family transcriptional regulator [Bacillus tianshenii]|nr:PucR family transcriptional regulator [Bacillus tianshenii]